MSEEAKEGRKLPKNVTLTPKVIEWGDSLVDALQCGNFSEMVTTLIREERERRIGPIYIPGAATTPLDSDKVPSTEPPRADGVPADLAQHAKEFSEMKKEQARKGERKKPKHN